MLGESASLEQKLTYGRSAVKAGDEAPLGVIVHPQLVQGCVHLPPGFGVEAVEAFLGHEQHGVGAVPGGVLGRAQQPEQHLLALMHGQPFGVPRWEGAVKGTVPEDAVLVEPGDPSGSPVGVVDDEGLGVSATGGVQLNVQPPSDADRFADLKTGIELGDEAFEGGLFLVALRCWHAVTPHGFDRFRRRGGLIGKATGPVLFLAVAARDARVPEVVTGAPYLAVASATSGIVVSGAVADLIRWSLWQNSP